MNKLAHSCAFALLAGLVMAQAPQSAQAAETARSVVDDSGAAVTLKSPAKRVISLAPHVTEMLFAAGGSAKQIVGVVSYSDFPPEAKQIQNVGDNRQWDMERILALKPDLLVVWRHGNAERQIDALRTMGVPLFYSEPQKIEDIAESIAKLGVLLGTEKQANASANQLRAKVSQLKQQYEKRPVVRTFYQVWDKPLYTLNGKHIVSDALRLCGGENIFANMNVTAPNVSMEAVMKENPEVIISGDQVNQSSGGIGIWKPVQSVLAVQRGNLFSLNADLMNRSGPRMVEGMTYICEKLELARKKRK